MWIRFLSGLFAFAVFLVSAPQAIAGPWFMHEFGELRAYHKDWLAVCANGGKGACRVVQIKLENKNEPFFGDARLAVNEGDPEGAPWIELFARNIPAPLGALIVRIDGKQVAALEPLKGYQPARNTMETYWIDDAAIVNDLLPQMLAGNTIVFDYQANENGLRKQVSFSLRGITAALRAIEEVIKKR